MAGWMNGCKLKRCDQWSFMLKNWCVHPDANIYKYTYKIKFFKIFLIFWLASGRMYSHVRRHILVSSGKFWSNLRPNATFIRPNGSSSEFPTFWNFGYVRTYVTTRLEVQTRCFICQESPRVSGCTSIFVWTHASVFEHKRPLITPLQLQPLIHSAINHHNASGPYKWSPSLPTYLTPQLNSISSIP